MGAKLRNHEYWTNCSNIHSFLAGPAVIRVIHNATIFFKSIRVVRFSNDSLDVIDHQTMISEYCALKKWLEIKDLQFFGSVFQCLQVDL